MTTYASPRLTRFTLQILISILFVAGLIMFLVSIIRIIDYFSEQNQSESNSTTVDQLDRQHLQANKQFDLLSEPRFPSVRAPSVQSILALITISHAIFGIIAITKEQISLISSYSFVLIISFCIKLILLFATLVLLIATEQSLLEPIPTLIIITSLIEILLVMFSCQFAKLVKLGDAARQEIQSIHSYHLEQRSSRSRSRSQSQSRFRSPNPHSNSPFLNGRPTPLIIHSGSRAVSVEPSMRSIQTLVTDTFKDINSEYYVPPSIFLKLDR